jgi:phosphoserine phosphatase RsbU/P
VVLFSDGVPEAQNEAGEEFGEDRLAALVSAAAATARGSSSAVSAIDQFAARRPQYDDVTVLVARRDVGRAHG